MIYLIAARDAGYCKIGYAGDVLSRLATLQTASPFDLDLVATREGEQALERHVHAQARDFHVRREWFRFVPEVVSIFHGAELSEFGASLPRHINEAAAIIERLGGAPAVSKALRVPYTTITSWREKNVIPAWRHDDLLSLSDGRISASDFPPKSARISKAAAAA